MVKASRKLVFALLLALSLCGVASATHNAGHGLDVAGCCSNFKEAITATTELVAAPPAGNRVYVTGVVLSNQAATVQTVDLVYGTGTNCATGATALTHKIQMGTNATTTSPFVVAVPFSTAVPAPEAKAVCARPSAATAFGVTLTYYIAP